MATAEWISWWVNVWFGAEDKHLRYFFIIFELYLLWASLIIQLVKNPPTMLETLVQLLGQEDPLEKGQPTPSYSLGLPSWLSWERIHLQCGRPGFDSRVGKIPCRREMLPRPVFGPGEFHGLYTFVKATETYLFQFNRKIATCVHGLGTDTQGKGVEFHRILALGGPQRFNPTCPWSVNPLLSLCINSWVTGTFCRQRWQAGLGLLPALESFSLSRLK